MLDFKRIGGEIVSSPLNENFKKLRNDISISNTNLVFSETEPVKDTITDMMSIEEPVNGQVCYVVSSGELYRYAIHDEEWHKIADFGQTFRQGFLNSGAVVLEDYITLKENSLTVLNIPRMLVYFKNKAGDNRYLKGMYLLEAAELDITNLIQGANAYSIFTTETGDYSISSGMPQTDSPDRVYLGTFLVDKDNNIMPDFIYTLPDIAYTADRSGFLLNGGQAEGCNLVKADSANNKVNRMPGFYYDEGINFTIGDTSNYPVDTDNGSNFDLKGFEAQSPVDKIFYMVPVNPLANEVEETDGLICNKYWNGQELAEVPEGYFTIQQHLITPNGQNVIIYGTQLYNSLTDAVSNLNTVYGLEINFPYVEVTRIVLGNYGDSFATQEDDMCQFFTLGRLAQVGTISPEFADNMFKIYSGSTEDTTPPAIKFVLDDLQKAGYNQLYNLQILPFEVDRKYFYNDKKYNTDTDIATITPSVTTTRKGDILEGYYLADNVDLQDAINRINNIEAEIWEPEKAEQARHNQSIRYRLFHTELRLDGHDNLLTEYGERIQWLEENKVYKGTTINGHELGKTTAKDEVNEVVLITDDISEKSLTPINRWFTEDRVRETDWVDESHTHYMSISSGEKDTELSATSVDNHVQVNPHNLSTDDLVVLSGSRKVFVTPEQERSIRADRLPENTIQALADLDARNLDTIQIDQIEGNSISSTGEITNIGNVKGIRFYEDGVGLNVTQDGSTLVVECKGQIDEDTVMLRNVYARQEMQDPTNPELVGAVDKALTAFAAYGIHGIASAGADKYYGTDEEGTPGIYDIAKYVTTVSADAFTDIDQVAYAPIEGSIQDKHLSEELKAKVNNNFHTAYSDGTLVSDSVNAINFGDNLDVHMDGNILTVNASGEGDSNGVTNFANLEDVSVIYTGNAGKTLIINETEDGVTFADTPSLDEYMLESVYVDKNDVTKVRKAVQADKATTAETATNALAVNTKVVDDTKNTNGVLWTAEKIITNTSSQIANEGVTTYSGTTVPSDSLGKNGDLYILIEG